MRCSAILGILGACVVAILAVFLVVLRERWGRGGTFALLMMTVVVSVAGLVLSFVPGFKEGLQETKAAFVGVALIWLVAAIVHDVRS